MKPINKGHIVKFHTPLPEENPNQLYVVLDLITDNERPRADIQALNTGLSFPPINTVRLGDLEIVQVDNNDLIGHKVTINKSDYSQVEGRVVKLSEQKVEVNLSSTLHGVETNVWLTVIDNEGIEHSGTLFISPE